MGADETYSIDELAAEAGMTPRNVRAYRTRGLLPEPLRRGRVTRYDRRHLERLLDIRELRQAGIPLRLITEAAGRGTDLGPESDLWRLTPSPAGRDRPRPLPDPPAPPMRAGPPASVDLRGAGGQTLDVRARSAGRQRLDAALSGHLDRDVVLRRQLTALGVLSGEAGRHCSTDVSLSLRGLAMHGVTPGTALTLVVHAAEAAAGLALRVNVMLGDAGHSLTPALQDLVEALAVGVTRDMLAREFERVR